MFRPRRETSLLKNGVGGTDDPISRAGIEAQPERRDVWAQQGESGLGQIERVVLTCVHSQGSARELVGRCCMQRAQHGTLRGPGGAGALSRGAQEGGVYAATWLILLRRRHSHTIAKQLSSTSAAQKASAYSAGDLGSVPGSGRCPGEGSGNPLQYSCLENPMDGGAWRATVHGVSRVRHD